MAIYAVTNGKVNSDGSYIFIESLENVIFLCLISKNKYD